MTIYTEVTKRVAFCVCDKPVLGNPNRPAWMTNCLKCNLPIPRPEEVEKMEDHLVVIEEKATEEKAQSDKPRVEFKEMGRVIIDPNTRGEHIQLNIRDTKGKFLGVVGIGNAHIYWMPYKSTRTNPIKKTWEEFANLFQMLG